MDLVTTKDLAQILGCSERWVQKLCERRSLPAAKVVGHWFIRWDEAALRRVLLRRRKNAKRKQVDMSR